MNVLLISPLPPPMGGIATLTERMMSNLSSSEIVINCVNVAHAVNNNNKKITHYNRIEPILIMLRTIFCVFTKCLTKQCDIIHINSSSGDGTLRDYFVEKTANLFKIPVILHYHCNLNNAVANSRIAKKYYIKWNHSLFFRD